jgi:PAS domain S-box-containing protein
MKTQSRILFSIVVSVGVSALIATSAFFIMRGMSIELERSRVYDEVIGKTHALNVLIATFTEDSDGTDISQLRQVRASLADLLKKLSSLDAREEALVRQIQRNNQELGLLLDLVLAPGTRPDQGGMEQERKDILSSQLWMKVRIISDDTYRLRDISQSRIVSAQTHTGMTVLFLLGALILTNTLISFLSGRSIVRAQQALHESDEMLRAVLDQMPSGVTVADARTGALILSNARSREILGALVEDPEQFARYRGFHADGLQYRTEEWPVSRSVATGEVVNTEEIECERSDGSRITLSISSAPVRDSQGMIVIGVGIFDDITERKRMEKERETTVEFLHLVNQSSGTTDLVRAAATFYQRQSGCEAVGIRLKEGDDYPYREARGFPREFVVMENSLCARDAAGDIVRDSAGNPYIECMCGNVIRGRVDPSKPFFSPGGSFWANSTTRLLAVSSDADRQTRTRNRCNGEGYESVALIPLCLGTEQMGLVQLNDRRTGMFSPEVIAQWERLAGYLAVALAKFSAEEDLRRSEVREREQAARLQAILDAAPALIWSAHDAECRTISGNRAARTMSRVDESTNMSKSGPEAERIAHYRIRKDGKELAPEEMPIQIVAKSGRELRDYALEFVLDDDTEYSLLGNVTPVLNSEGNPSGAIGAFLDITGRKLMEEELRKSRDELELRVKERTVELERSNQALQDFASIASHDLQEPLRKVSSFGNMLNEKYGESLGEQGKDYLARMLNANQRMQSLLTALLEYSRLSTTTDPFVEVELTGIVREVLLDLEVRIEKTGGRVRVGELPVIQADPTQMRQLFQNLIGNGLKFHKEGERPVVDVSCTMADDRTLRIVIEDNGIGFDEQYLDRIFAPFQRLHGKSSQYEGTGMGLAICKKIVERHGGHITARSSPGKGTAFIIALPQKHL